MEVYIKDEGTDKDRYFIYVRNEAGWINFTGLRFSSYVEADRVVNAILKAMA